MLSVLPGTDQFLLRDYNNLLSLFFKHAIYTRQDKVVVEVILVPPQLPATINNLQVTRPVPR